MSLLNISTSNFVLVKDIHVNPLNFSFPYMLSLIVYYNGILNSERKAKFTNCF